MTAPAAASREKYFLVALEILTEQGSGQLTMTALHRRLDVSSGSFYHFFRGWDDFVRQFLDHWIEQTPRISAEAGNAVNPLDRLEALRHLAGTVPHAAEAAIRIWSAGNLVVAAAQAQIDTQRLAIIRDAVMAAGVPESDAGHLSRHGLSLIAGWQQLSRPFDMAALDEMLGSFIDLVQRSGDRS